MESKSNYTGRIISKLHKSSIFKITENRIILILTLIMTIILVIQFLNAPYPSEKIDLIEANPETF